MNFAAEFGNSVGSSGDVTARDVNVPDRTLPFTQFVSGSKYLLLCTERSVLPRPYSNCAECNECDFFLNHGATAPPSGPRPPHCLGFTTTLRHTTLGRTPLDEWSAPRTDLYLTTHNTHNRQTSMPPVGFEPTIPAGERPQTHALDRAATGTGNESLIPCVN